MTLIAEHIEGDTASSIREHRQIRLPFGDGKISPIASEDSVARVIAVILEDPGRHIGKVYELTGPRSQDMNGVAEEFSRALGHQITYVNVPWGPWRTQLENSGQLSPHALAHLATMALLKHRNRYGRLTSNEKVTGTPPLSVYDFVLRHAAMYMAGSEKSRS